MVCPSIQSFDCVQICCSSWETVSSILAKLCTLKTRQPSFPMSSLGYVQGPLMCDMKVLIAMLLL